MYILILSFLIFRPGPRDATLDFENGEFICPMCRQVANALLPVPPDAPPYPLSHSYSQSSSSSKIRQIALNIHDLLGQETLLMSDGPTPLKSEMSKIVQVCIKKTKSSFKVNCFQFSIFFFLSWLSGASWGLNNDIN